MLKADEILATVTEEQLCAAMKALPELTPEKMRGLPGPVVTVLEGFAQEALERVAKQLAHHNICLVCRVLPAFYIALSLGVVIAQEQGQKEALAAEIGAADGPS